MPINIQNTSVRTCDEASRNIAAETHVGILDDRLCLTRNALPAIGRCHLVVIATKHSINRITNFASTDTATYKYYNKLMRMDMKIYQVYYL